MTGMAKSPELYNLKKTTVVFAVASGILLLGLLGMVLQDSARDWKEYQRSFMDYNRRKAQEELAKVQKATDQKSLEKLRLHCVPIAGLPTKNAPGGLVSAERV